jgi:hypothetical protein
MHDAGAQSAERTGARTCSLPIAEHISVITLDATSHEYSIEVSCSLRIELVDAIGQERAELFALGFITP